MKQTHKNYFILQNIRIMAKFYTKITLTRMAELMDLSIEVKFLK